MKQPLQFIVRTLVFSLFWGAWWYTSAWFYGRFIHDVGGTYWFLGIYAYPVAIVLYCLADFFILMQKMKPPIFYLSVAIATVLLAPAWFAVAKLWLQLKILS